MKIIKKYDQNEINLIDNIIIQGYQKEKFTDWERTFFIRNLTDGKIAIVSLDIFERIVCMLQKIFCRNYSKFETVFKTKNIKIISPSDLKPTEKKVDDQAKLPIKLKKQEGNIPLNPIQSEPVFKPEKDGNQSPLDKHQTPIASPDRSLRDYQGIAQNYPAYFDELLDNGYTHLYNHLIQMRAIPSRNERRSEIEKITFSLLSHVVLEAREAVIQKVESAIPADHHNILFLLGGSGAGKSTTLCFLRGDRMVLKNFHYQSQSDKSRLIGHNEETSCTFLPTVEIVNDLVIVDFPGFDDTNGQIISLGMEFALKALIKKYSPKILVLEAITNTEGKFAAAAQLGLRLRRLLDNKENCRLGITKYSKDPDFGKIKAIEEQQKKECSVAEENLLMGKIQALIELDMPDLLPKIQELQQQLAKIRQEQAQKLQLPLPETDEKIERKRRIEKTENKILKQIGLESIIRFCDLEDPNHLSQCLTTLSQLPEKESIRPNPQQLLDPHDKQLLENLFTNNLVKEMKTKNYIIEFKDFKAFEQSVLESSFIKTILSQSNPEIGQFLHLPEIDPTIVRKYDREIVGSCIKEFMRAVISTLNISLIEKILQEMKPPKEKVKALKEKLTHLQRYVLGLLGAGALSEDSKQAAIEWSRIQNEHKITMDAVEDGFNLPTWAKVCPGIIPIGIPRGIYTLFKWNAQDTANQKAIEETINRCCNELEQIYDTLLRLKDIEKIIEKQEAIDEAFKSVSSKSLLSILSFSSLTKV